MQIVSQAVSRRFLPSGDMVPALPDNRFHLAGIITALSGRVAHCHRTGDSNPSGLFIYTICVFEMRQTIFPNLQHFVFHINSCIQPYTTVALCASANPAGYVGLCPTPRLSIPAGEIHFVRWIELVDFIKHARKTNLITCALFDVYYSAPTLPEASAELQYSYVQRYSSIFVRNIVLQHQSIHTFNPLIKICFSNRQRIDNRFRLDV